MIYKKKVAHLSDFFWQCLQENEFYVIIDISPNESVFLFEIAYGFPPQFQGGADMKNLL